MKKYSDKLKDPRWQKRRLEIFERDKWECQICWSKESTLHVHHRYYEKGHEPWDYADDALITLCEYCHQEESDNKSQAEYLLLRAIRKKFFSRDIELIAEGFENFNPFHIREVCSLALSYLIRESDLLRELYDQYFDYWLENHKKD